MLRKIKIFMKEYLLDNPMAGDTLTVTMFHILNLMFILFIQCSMLFKVVSHVFLTALGTLPGDLIYHNQTNVKSRQGFTSFDTEENLIF